MNLQVFLFTLCWPALILISVHIYKSAIGIAYFQIEFKSISISIQNVRSISAAFVPCNTLSSNKNIDSTAKCGAGVTFSSIQTEVAKDVVIGAGSKFVYGLKIGMGTTLGENINAGNNVVIGEQVCIENGVNLIANTDIKDFVKVIRTKKGFTIVDEKEGFKFMLINGKCSLIKR